MQGPARAILPNATAEMDFSGTAADVRHVQHSSAAAVLSADPDLYGRDAILFETLSARRASVVGLQQVKRREEAGDCGGRRPGLPRSQRLHRRAEDW